jgi:hypothetical protein
MTMTENKSAELAGFFAAHAVWCVSDGSTLIPLLAYEMPDGSRQMSRFSAEMLEDGIEPARQWMAENPDGAACAAFVYDGYITLESGKTDSLFIDVRSYEGQETAFRMAIPYRHASHVDGFAVHRPKFLSCDAEQPDYKALSESFFQGVDQHEKGSTIWNDHLDESI